MSHRILMPIFRPRMGIVAEAVHQGEHFSQWHVRGYSNVLTNRNKTESTIVSPKIEADCFTWYMFLLYRRESDLQDVCLKVWGKSKVGCITYKKRRVVDFKLKIRRRKKKSLLVHTGRVEFFGEHQTLATVKLPSEKIVKRNRCYDHDKLYVSMRLRINLAHVEGEANGESKKIDELMNRTQEPGPSNHVDTESTELVNFIINAEEPGPSNHIESESIQLDNLVNNAQESWPSNCADSESTELDNFIKNAQEPGPSNRVGSMSTERVYIVSSSPEPGPSNRVDSDSADLIYFINNCSRM